MIYDFDGIALFLAVLALVMLVKHEKKVKRYLKTSRRRRKKSFR